MHPETHEKQSEPAPQSPLDMIVPVAPAASGGDSEPEKLNKLDGPFIIRTLAEMGPNLPVGILNNEGKRVRTFRLRPMRMKEEKEIGKYREKTKGLTMGLLGSQVLATMVQTVGPYSFDTMDEGQRKLRLSQMTMADVLYMYIWLRYEVMGADEPVSMQLTCPACRNDFNFAADLGTLEVRTVPDDDTTDLTRELKLRDGLPVKGTIRNVLKLRPLLWGTFSLREFNTLNVASRDAAMIRHSIVGVEGWDDRTPFVMREEDLDELTRYDVSSLVNDIQDNSPGPIIGVDAVCAMCHSGFRVQIDWTYDSFFSRSSASTRRKF